MKKFVVALGMLLFNTTAYAFDFFEKKAEDEGMYLQELAAQAVGAAIECEITQHGQFLITDTELVTIFVIPYKSQFIVEASSKQFRMRGVYSKTPTSVVAEGLELTHVASGEKLTWNALTWKQVVLDKQLDSKCSVTFDTDWGPSSSTWTKASQEEVLAVTDSFKFPRMDFALDAWYSRIVWE